MTAVFRKTGHRLTDRRDPAVRLALGKPCPECKAEPDGWCVFTLKGRAFGRPRTRLHYARCTFQPADVS